MNAIADKLSAALQDSEEMDKALEDTNKLTEEYNGLNEMTDEEMLQELARLENSDKDVGAKEPDVLPSPPPLSTTSARAVGISQGPTANAVALLKKAPAVPGKKPENLSDVNI